MKGIINSKNYFNFNLDSLFNISQRKKTVTINETRRFHKKKKTIIPTIMETIGPKEIIYGSTATNKYLPSWLDVPANDIDVFSPTPRKDAVQAERRLDKRFGGNFFYVKQARHPDTFRVVAYPNEETYADFTKPDVPIPSRTIQGKRYVTIPFIKKHIRETLNDPYSSYRHGKDRDTLNRILLYEKMRRK